MPNRALLALLAALPLAACNSEPEVSMRNATVGEVAKEVADAGGPGAIISPGRWEAKMAIEEMSMPGMPAEMAATMKGVGSNQPAHITCLTPEEAQKPKEDFFAGGNDNCKYDRFTMSGGKIDAVMKCTRQGSSQEMTLAGSYAPDAYNMTVSATTTGKGPDAGMKMRMRVDAKRLGACDGAEGKA